MRNLNRYLEDQLELEVKMNRLDETELKISPHLHDHMVIMPQSVSIWYASSDRGEAAYPD